MNRCHFPGCGQVFGNAGEASRHVAEEHGCMKWNRETQTFQHVAGMQGSKRQEGASVVDHGAGSSQGIGPFTFIPEGIQPRSTRRLMLDTIREYYGRMTLVELTNKWIEKDVGEGNVPSPVLMEDEWARRCGLMTAGLDVYEMFSPRDTFRSTGSVVADTTEGDSDSDESEEEMSQRPS